MEILSKVIKPITVYHGDNFGTTKLEPKWMLHKESNNQEGGRNLLRKTRCSTKVWKAYCFYNLRFI